MSNRPVGHIARKRFGQNFLHDADVIEKITRVINPKSADNLVEIGPGQGALTESLLKAGDGKLTAVELDRDLVPGLRTQFFNYPEFSVVQADALKYDFRQLGSEDRPLRLIGNLPYNISTPLIFHLLEQRNIVRDMHFMLQKEVVERMAASPGGGDYGRLSIMAQYFCKIDSLFLVGPGSFKPAPKVWSAVVRLRPHCELPHPCRNHKMLERVVKQAFAMRRKTLRNALKILIASEDIERLHIDPQARPETLSLQDYVALADFITQQESERS